MQTTPSEWRGSECKEGTMWSRAAGCDTCVLISKTPKRNVFKVVAQCSNSRYWWFVVGSATWKFKSLDESGFEVCEHCVLLPSNENASNVIYNYCKATVTKVAIDAEPLGLIWLSIDSFLVNWTHAVGIYGGCQIDLLFIGLSTCLKCNVSIIQSFVFNSSMNLKNKFYLAPHIDCV